MHHVVVRDGIRIVRVILHPSKRTSLTVLSPCIHGGTDDDILERCPSCNGGSKHVRECEIYEKCTWEEVNPSVMNCRKCRNEGLGYEPIPNQVSQV
jgi:hypothetical protein